MFSKKITVNTDKEKIDGLLSRSIDTIYPSKDSLRAKLLSGKQIKVFVGIDPTADYVHLGHSTNYLSRCSTLQPKIAGPNHQLARSEALPVANPMR